MTRYILNSGGISKAPDRGASFFAEIVKGLGKSGHILMCFFAQLREDWEMKFAEYSEGFQEQLPAEIKPKFELAFPDRFVQQVSNADAIYLHGGDDHLVQYWLRQFDPKIWTGKVVATNSASSNALSSSFWTCDWRQCFDGQGVLPIKFISHFNSDYGSDDPRGPIDWEAARKELEAHGDTSLPIYALEEGEFEVFEIKD
jgi:hypothetical protein